MTKPAIALCSLLLLAAACNDDGGRNAETNNNNSETANNDDPTGNGDGDGDGDPTGDGDGSPTGDGDGDPTGEPEGSFCIHQCSIDADCQIGGQDAGLSCVDKTCIGASTKCDGNEECVALFSGWATPCTAGGNECSADTQACIVVEGQGRCASKPNDFFDCATLQMEEIQTTDINGSPVTVCGRPHAACHPDAYCYLPCQGNGDCPSAAYPICNVSTGFCECGQDSHCATLNLPGSSVCNAGICGCDSDQDCIAGTVGDVCNQGFCGCTGDQACAGIPNYYDGGMVSCVEF